MTPIETLQAISDRLAESSPVQVIEQLLPRIRSDALTWARRLPAWDEHRGQFPDQVIGLALTISRRTMREHRLLFNENGQIVERQTRPTPRPTTFQMEIAGEHLTVQHTRDYYPGMDSVYYTKAEPGPHSLSETGHWHQFAPHDAVEAGGGAEAFARLLAEARIAGQEKAFMEAFEGKPPEIKVKKRKPVEAVGDPEAAEEPPTEEPAQHAARVVERRGTGQGRLF